MSAGPIRPRERLEYRAVDGVLLLDKPPGFSSNAALQRVRRLYRAARAGHTGTLDPFATGLLPIAFGEGTKFSSGLLDADKSYLAHLRLGIRTSTGDPEGEIVETRAVNVDREQVMRALQRFIGPIEQTPPMYSALKLAGRPLYAYARAGEEVPRAPRCVIVHMIEIESFVSPTLVIRVRCSKGTYIRTLAEDLGSDLGCGAHLERLRRTAVGDLQIEDAHSIPSIEGMTEAERIALLGPVDALVRRFPRTTVDAQCARRLSQGLRVPLAAVEGRASPGSPMRAYRDDGLFIGLVTASDDQELKPLRLVSQRVD